MDVLVVVDGHTIVYPWRQETDSLKSWEWHSESDSAASYVGTKWTSDTDLDEDDHVALRRNSEATTILTRGGDEDTVEPGQMWLLNERAARLFPIDAYMSMQDPLALVSPIAKVTHSPRFLQVVLSTKTAPNFSP